MLYQCRARAIRQDSPDFNLSWRWAVARHDVMRFFDDHMLFGEWSIPYDLIENAVLPRFPLRMLWFRLGACDNLTLSCEGQGYHFSIQPNSRFQGTFDDWFWQESLPFDVIIHDYCG